MDHDLVTPGERILAGVSGGADSTALALLLAHTTAPECGEQVVLGHVDHGWRGRSAADRDWSRIEALAARLGVRALRSPPPPPGTPRTEDAARRHRYHALRVMAEQVGATKVALAHHLGDQAETFLMRLLRGSGLIGLAGIPRRRPLGTSGVEVVRPLLQLDPHQLRELLRAEGISWLEDPSNKELHRDRARIRARIAAHHARDLAQLADRLRARVERREQAVLALAPERWQRYPHAPAVRLPRAWLQSLDTPLLLGLALRAAGRTIAADEHGPWFTRRHLQLAAQMLETGGALDLPHGVRLHVAGHGAWLHREPAPPTPLPELVVTEASALPPQGHDPAGGVIVDATRLGPAPVLRRLRADDSFVPFGAASGRRRPVTRWLSRRGIPGFARRGVLVVEGASGIAWVVGQRLDARHAITDTTDRALRLALH